jgi:uncharacterized protein (TIGR03067 family)
MFSERGSVSRSNARMSFCGSRTRAPSGRSPPRRSNSLMKITFVTVCCAALLAGGCSIFTKSDSAKLQGTWSGKEIVATPDAPRHLVFAGRKFDYRGGDPDDWCKGTFTIEPGTQPKQLVLTLTECGLAQYIGKTSQGIYKIENGTLDICGNEPGIPAVPASWNAPGARHMEFRKE